MRCDWLYDGDEPSREGISMIWPKFEDQDGAVVAESQIGTMSFAEFGSSRWSCTTTTCRMQAMIVSKRFLETVPSVPGAAFVAARDDWQDEFGWFALVIDGRAKNLMVSDQTGSDLLVT